MVELEKQARIRPSFYYLSTLLLLWAAFCLCYAHSLYAGKQTKQRDNIRRATVAVVGTADLAINNAARYIRHVSLTDVSTAFQDCPGCPDYFPGSLSTNPPDYAGIVTRLEKATP